MQNRVPTYPNRVRLTQVSGDIYDLTRADEPTEVGTPLNKETLLSDDAVSALTGAGLTLGDDTPSEAFEAIAGVIGANMQTAKIEIVEYTGTGTYGASNPTNVVFSFDPDYVIMVAEKSSSDLITSYLSYNSTRKTFQPIAMLTTSYVSTNSYGLINSSTAGTHIRYTPTNKTLSFYSTGTGAAKTQYNESGNTYYVLAIKEAS